MFNTIKSFLGLSPKVDYVELIKEGALILDVRTGSEYQSGHIKDSRNIPLDNLSGQISKLNKNKKIITCCASGIRSAMARRILISRGFSNVYNGGSWKRLQNKITA